MRRTLVVRAGALGDLLLLRPAIASLQDAGDDVTLLAPVGPAAALRGTGRGDVRDLRDWNSPHVASLLSGNADGGGDFWRGFDRAVVYSENAELTEALKQHVPNVLAHSPTPAPGFAAAQWFCEPLRLWGVPQRAVPPCLPTEAERQSAEDVRRLLPPRFIAVHAGSGAARKNWPQARFIELAESLVADAPWLWIEGPAEDRASSLPTRAVRATTLPLRALGALLKEAALYVGNDSGITHLAAAWGTPTLALYGPTDPNVWKPYGVRVRTLQAHEGEMTSLRLDEVQRAIKSMDLDINSTGPERP